MWVKKSVLDTAWWLAGLFWLHCCSHLGTELQNCCERVKHLGRDIELLSYLQGNSETHSDMQSHYD